TCFTPDNAELSAFASFVNVDTVDMNFPRPAVDPSVARILPKSSADIFVRLISSPISRKLFDESLADFAAVVISVLISVILRLPSDISNIKLARIDPTSVALLTDRHLQYVAD